MAGREILSHYQKEVESERLGSFVEASSASVLAECLSPGGRE